MVKPVDHDTVSAVTKTAGTGALWAGIAALTAVVAPALIGITMGGLAAPIIGVALSVAAFAFSPYILGAGAVAGLFRGANKVSAEENEYHRQKERRQMRGQHKALQAHEMGIMEGTQAGYDAGVQEGFGAGYQKGQVDLANQVNARIQQAKEQQAAAHAVAPGEAKPAKSFVDSCGKCKTASHAAAVAEQQAQAAGQVPGR